jgi:hypothetical protein
VIFLAVAGSIAAASGDLLGCLLHNFGW